MLTVKFPVGDSKLSNHRVFDISHCDRVEVILGPHIPVPEPEKEPEGGYYSRVIGVTLIHFKARTPASSGTFEERYSFTEEHPRYRSCYVEDVNGRTIDYICVGKEV